MKKFKLPEQSSSLSPLTQEEMQNISDKTKDPVGTCKCNVYIEKQDNPIVFIEECYPQSRCSSHCDAIAATYEKCTSHKSYLFPYSKCPGSPFCKCGSDCNCPHDSGSGSGSGSDESEGEKL